MRHVIILSGFVLFASVVLGADKPRQTTDKKPLPDAAELKIDMKLQLVGARLGGLPEDVATQLWELKSDLEVVKAARRQLNEMGIDQKDYDYLAGGVAGSTRTLIDIEDGRVRRLLLFFPSMSADLAKDRMAKLAADATEKPREIGQNSCVFAMDGTQYFARAVGEWEKVKGAERGIYSHSDAKTLRGPAAIEVGVDAMDWYVTNTCQTKEILQAVREERLVPGMRMVEAYLAMRKRKLYRVKQGANAEQWTWTKEKYVLNQYDVIVTDYGRTVSSRMSVSQEAIMTAEFKDGVLTTSSEPNAIPQK